MITVFINLKYGERANIITILHFLLRAHLIFYGHISQLKITQAAAKKKTFIREPAPHF